jgi:hypothetical protein
MSTKLFSKAPSLKLYNKMSQESHLNTQIIITLIYMQQKVRDREIKRGSSINDSSVSRKLDLL